MSVEATASDAPRPAKKMRKGTRSCLACRRRKLKCTFVSDASKTCVQCEQHNFQCIPQGAAIDDSDPSLDRRLKLKERVDQLQLLVNQLMPNSREYAGSTGDDNDPLVKALEDLLPGVHEAAAAEGTRRPTTVPFSHDHHDEAEEPLESNAAPLMRILGDEVQSSTDKPTNSRRPRHLEAIIALMTAMPSQDEMERVFTTQSSWWQLWRTNLDLVWGSAETDTLRSFAALALKERDPTLLAILLVAFATATGDRRRYLPPVELYVVHNDELASSEHGLSCLMILGLCYLNNLQPRRAWSVYRRANSLLQLNGIHLRHRGSPKREGIFWQLFHADRWVSLMIGLPYMVPDHLIDVSIGTVDELGASTYLYRHLAVLTGRVVDCLNEANGPSLAAALQVEEQMHNILKPLPTGYLDIKQIRACTDRENTMTRLYRSVHLHQLRAYLHVSFFLRPSSSDRYEYSRTSCVNDSRKLVEAYVEIFATDPSAASDGSVLNCTAFTATVVVLISIVGVDRGGERPRSHAAYDWQLIYRALDALKYGQGGVAGELCRQCYNALDTLIKCARSDGAEGATVVLPYFGTVTCKPKPDTRGEPADTCNKDKHGQAIFTPESIGSGLAPASSTDAIASTGAVLPDGLEFDYAGPFSLEGPVGSWQYSDWPNMQAAVGGELPWDSNFDADTGWDWINADLPPTMTF